MSISVQEAEKIGKAPDFLYCKELLDNTGIVTVPGSGFRQVHFICNSCRSLKLAHVRNAEVQPSTYPSSLSFADANCNVCRPCQMQSTHVYERADCGYVQVEGTFHFRTTFLPSEKDIVAVCDRLKKFHGEFIKKYGSPEK